MDVNAFGYLLWIPIVYLVYAYWKKQQKYAKGKPEFKKIESYDSGPMKVDVAFQEVPARTIEHRHLAGDNWWRMHMNIHLSKKDWELFERSGLAEYEMFSCPNYDFPKIKESYHGRALKHMPSHRDFPSIQEAEAAKDELIRSLHAVRSRIDDMRSNKDGVPDRERFEI